MNIRKCMFTRFVFTNTQNVADELITIHTALDYQLLDSVFDLNQYVGLIELDDDQVLSKSILQPPAVTKNAQDITAQ